MTEKTSSNNVPKYTIHMTLQHKGGVTKSFTANCLAQLYQHKKTAVTIIDADPSNKTLAGFKALNVKAIDIMSENNTIDSRKFDDLIESFVSNKNDFIVDNGATNFLPFMSYMLTNNVAQVLAENGRRLVVHVPIVGGSDTRETLVGLAEIAESFENDGKLVVWLNEAVKGPIQVDGKSFEDMKVYETHKSKILALVRVPHHGSELFGQDMEELLTKKNTFAEAIESPETRLMSKQRIKQMQREIFEQLEFLI